nr:radical SAM protein [Desulfobulbaceae bacterium]
MSTQLKARTLAFQPNERNIFLHLLTACNLSCRHCYINTKQHGSNTLDIATITDWLKLFYRKNSQSNVIFLGGEPTLHPDLPAAVKSAKKIGYQTITIDTNGFLHNDLLSKIDSDDAVISFSLDGPRAEINDPIRGENVFATCTENLQKAVAAGFETSVIYTVSSLNINHLKDMPALLHKLGCRHFFIQVIGLRGKSATTQTASPSPNLQITHEQWIETVPAVAEHAAALGMHVIYPKVFLDPDEIFQCAGTVAENFFIFPNGRVYTCPLCEDFPLHSYEIRNNKLTLHEGITEKNLFSLSIPEGCVINKLLQPGSIDYLPDGSARHRISCCLLKQEI